MQCGAQLHQITLFRTKGEAGMVEVAAVEADAPIAFEL